VTDRVLVPLPDGRWLAIAADAFAEALVAGAEAMGVAGNASGNASELTTQLMTAEELAARLKVDASWVLTSARLNEIPCVRLGKYVRFDLAAVIQHRARHPDTRIGDPRTPPKLLNRKHL
jgi:excisionase family DNA binding protein